MRNTNQSYYQALCKVIPGGVNSPFRGFQLVGGSTPPILTKGSGPYVWDCEGTRYLDYCGAWGPLVLGHTHPAIVEAACQAIQEGSVFGASTPWELELAQALVDLFEDIDMVRFVNSGAEAVRSAVRLARSATQRDLIIKFEGHYHGHVECLDSVGLEAQESGGCKALGVPQETAQTTIVLPYWDLDGLQQAFKDHPQKIAGVICEPVTGSMGVIVPPQELLRGIQELTHQEGALFILDEVLTGFRIGLRGARDHFDIQPDITCWGKALSGGFPVGAYGARKELMSLVAPLGPVYQAGTYSGNPVTVRAGIAALKQYQTPNFYQELSHKTQTLCQGLQAIFPDLLAPHIGGMFSLSFGPSQLKGFEDAQRFDTDRFEKFFFALLEKGVYLPPSTFDAAGVSQAHSLKDIEETLSLARQVKEQLK